MNKRLALSLIIVLVLFLNGCSIIIKPEAEVQIIKDTSCSEGYAAILKVHGEQKEKQCISKQDLEDFLSMTISEHSDLEDKGN